MIWVNSEKIQWQVFRLGNSFKEGRVRYVQTEHLNIALVLPYSNGRLRGAYKDEDLPLDTIFCWRYSEIEFLRCTSEFDETRKCYIDGPKGYLFFVRNKYYVTMGFRRGVWYDYSLGEAIGDIESFLSIEIIKEERVRELVKPFTFFFGGGEEWKLNVAPKLKALTPAYITPAGDSNHNCYDAEDIKKCFPACAICGKHTLRPIQVSLDRYTGETYAEALKICRELCCGNWWVCSKECSSILNNQICERVKLWLKQKRSQKQFRESRKLMAQSRRALREGDLNACKLLSEGFKRVATLH